MKIGIISGLGAAAGVRFYDLLIKAYQDKGAKQDNDFPEIFLHNLNSKGMNETGIVDSDLMLRDLTSSVEILNKCGAEVIMIACNSVHGFHKTLQSVSHAEILNMVDIAAESVKTKCVGVISSHSTRTSNLYQNALELHEIDVIQTTDEQQIIIDDVIANVISGTHGYTEQYALADIANAMYGKGAQAIILACTELPLAANASLQFIDPTVETIKKIILL